MVLTLTTRTRYDWILMVCGRIQARVERSIVMLGEEGKRGWSAAQRMAPAASVLLGLGTQRSRVFMRRGCREARGPCGESAVRRGPCGEDAMGG